MFHHLPGFNNVFAISEHNFSSFGICLVVWVFFCLMQANNLTLLKLSSFPMNTGYVFQHGCLRDEKLLIASVILMLRPLGGLGTVGSNNYKLKLNSQIRLQVLLPKTKISLTSLNLALISNLRRPCTLTCSSRGRAAPGGDRSTEESSHTHTHYH